LSINSLVTRQPKIATCARKVMSLPSANTKDFWVLLGAFGYRRSSKT
jgi:hypothetical protein